MCTEEEVDHVGVAAEAATVVDEGDHRKDQTASPHPETSCCQAWKGKRARTELHRDNGNAEADRQWQQRAEHEPHPLRIKDLGHGAIVNVADAAPLNPKNHVDGDRAQKSQQASTKEQSADLLVVG